LNNSQDSSDWRNIHDCIKQQKQQITAMMKRKICAEPFPVKDQIGVPHESQTFA
jgi:hypothetical protein